MYNNIIENNILLLSRLQGIGSRSSRRILLDLMKKKEGLLKPLISSLQELYDSIIPCEECFNLDTSNPCYICANPKRDRTKIAVVEDISGLWAIERASEKTNSYNGLYFVLGGTLSATKGATPESLRIPNLIDKIMNNANINEVILATSATSEGRITANYISDLIPENIKVSSLAQGIPMGGEIDYLDESTLSTAINLRTTNKL
ncbi:MAG: recombination mediator RecR [Alphaproteobacteria bacterium]|jgi:recombination protein RecR|nr:recombination mediator RecR [Alphaproteobacteria bacterium]